MAVITHMLESRCQDLQEAPVLFMAIRAWLQPLRRLFEELWTTAKREREEGETGGGQERKQNLSFVN